MTNQQLRTAAAVKAREAAEACRAIGTLPMKDFEEIFRQLAHEVAETPVPERRPAA